jgi:Holliday junction resolvase RusA-like endonuclease
MAKHFSFIAENVTPLSQNNRSTALITRLRNDLTVAHNLKYVTNPMPKTPRISGSLQAKVFYIHRVPDYKDADNISKPLWDSLNGYAYVDDEQIKYIETLKINVTTRDIFQLDITDIDILDLQVLLDFLDNTGGSKERILYVNVSDYESNKVRF